MCSKREIACGKLREEIKNFLRKNKSASSQVANFVCLGVRLALMCSANSPCNKNYRLAYVQPLHTENILYIDNIRSEYTHIYICIYARKESRFYTHKVINRPLRVFRRPSSESFEYGVLRFDTENSSRRHQSSTNANTLREIVNRFRVPPSRDVRGTWIEN